MAPTLWEAPGSFGINLAGRFVSASHVPGAGRRFKCVYLPSHGEEAL